jgi:hypothetical protein
MRHRYHWPALLLITAAVLLSGCQAESETADMDEPAVVESVEGTATPHLVLSEAAIGSLGIKTQPIVAGAAGLAVIPMAAVFYYPDGSTWTYTNREPRTYLREPVTISKIENDLGTLQAGPSAGTAVVVIGAAELLGTENGVGGG